MKNINPRGLFDEYFLLERLTKLKDPLVKLDAFIDWNIFAPVLDLTFRKPENSSKAGRPPFDRVMMFKLLILQSLYNLSDDQMEFQITDRLSFKRFLKLKTSDKVPDSKTIWKFRETLIQEGIIEALFCRFNQALDDQSVFANTGQIMDASFVEVPRQRNTREENKLVKNGETPEAWKSKPNKLRQKDRDARWTKKNNVSFYGYKNHIKTDAGTKLINDYTVTDASVHDSQELETLISLNDGGQKLYADSAYTGQETTINKYGMRNMVHEKGNRYHKLTEEQNASNREKSRTRARVEHVFGFMTNSMKAMYIRTIGYARATAKIGLTNLTYNMMRCVQLNKKVDNVFLWDSYAQ
ncbi:IS5 family transposase [Chlorobium phaeovibrioides]|uniref:IS5 family transposase n=1 Tax=Chlorobium phaeovibrioides TaxID=1094 RepID=UPI0021AD685A|nr:IS5 family transposase [Chlorobium phaeovibrioides]